MSTKNNPHKVLDDKVWQVTGQAFSAIYWAIGQAEAVLRGYGSDGPWFTEAADQLAELKTEVTRISSNSWQGYLDSRALGQYRVGQKVMALMTVTEGGPGVKGDIEAEMPETCYIHALPGDLGEVEDISEDGIPSVRFQPRGTATIVTPREIEVVEWATGHGKK